MNKSRLDRVFFLLVAPSAIVVGVGCGLLLMWVCSKLMGY